MENDKLQSMNLTPQNMPCGGKGEIFRIYRKTLNQHIDKTSHRTKKPSKEKKYHHREVL
jgi:hypothetical protein